jgi:hypothetical protein
MAPNVIRENLPASKGASRVEVRDRQPPDPSDMSLSSPMTLARATNIAPFVRMMTRVNAASLKG